VGVGEVDVGERQRAEVLSVAAEPVTPGASVIVCGPEHRREHRLIVVPVTVMVTVWVESAPYCR